MASFFSLWIWLCIVVCMTYGQYTSLYYDDMEDFQASGWFNEEGYHVMQTANDFCAGPGGVQLETGYFGGSSTVTSVAITRNFDINEYTDLVVAVDIGYSGLSGSYRVYLSYNCDPVWAQASSFPISLSSNSNNYNCDYNFTVSDYTQSIPITCSTAKTLNLRFSIFSNGGDAYLDEVRIFYGGTYAATFASPYSSDVFVYDNMSDVRSTWVLPCTGCGTSIQLGYKYCALDSSCLVLNGKGAYVTRYNIDTSGEQFVAVQYVFGTDISVGPGQAYFAQVQYTCGDGQTFAPIATHISGSTNNTYTAILPCTARNTAIRLYSYGYEGVYFDNICVVTWAEGQDLWSSTYCPESEAWADYSASIYWYDNFDSDLDLWTIDAPDFTTSSFYMLTTAAGKVMDGKHVRMNGNNVALISRAINGYSISYADIQFDVQTDCDRVAGNEFAIEIVCGLANYQWITLETFYGDFEARDYIVSSTCDQTGINQIRFRSVADQFAVVYIDNVYYCRSGECPGDENVNVNAGIIFYDVNVTNPTDTSWIHPANDAYYRRRFNNLNTCDDLFVQYDIVKDNFGVSDSVTVEYKYDATSTDSYCVDAGWSALTTHTGSDFVDQKILQVPNCTIPFHGSLTVRFSNDAGIFVRIENFYLCNDRSSCPAPYPTTSPTYDPTSEPTKDPTKGPIGTPTAYPSFTPTPPTKEPTLPRDDSVIAKEGYNCFSGYRDLPEDDPYHGVLCERCPDGTAGTYGKCEKCGFLEVPNDARDECEYYQPWWLWLGETVMGLGCVGGVIIVYKKGKKRRAIRQQAHQEMVAVNSSGEENGLNGTR